MPIRLQNKPDHNIYILSHEGEVSDNEFLTFYCQFFQSDGFDPSRNMLIDLHEADSRSRSADTLHLFAEFVREHLIDLTIQPKVAVVAPKSLSFGLARMYQSFALTVPWDFVVFRATDTALAWLGVSEDII